MVDSLSARDREVIQVIAEHRFLTTRQVEAFCFIDHATPLTAARVARRVLRRLQQQRLVKHLDRRIGGVRAGSASYVWQLDVVGERLRRGAAAPRRRQYEPSLLFLAHHLAVADIHLALVLAHRTQQLELLTVQTEPACWRDYQGVGGARLRLAPDLYVETGAGAYQDNWYLELDLGTENAKRLLEKCRRYIGYRRTGIEQDKNGSFPLVVWVMQTDTQATRLQTAIASTTDLDSDLFRVTTVAQVVPLLAGGAV